MSIYDSIQPGKRSGKKLTIEMLHKAWNKPPEPPRIVVHPDTYRWLKQGGYLDNPVPEPPDVTP